MTRKPLVLTASLLAAAALAPASALAGTADVRLGGAPTLRQIDAHHAQLRFATDERLERTKAGRIKARVTVSGRSVSGLAPSGRHGDDTVYTARVTSERTLRAGVKYTVKIAVPGQDAIVRKAKLHSQRG
jgi:hypothetical protein